MRGTGYIAFTLLLGLGWASGCLELEVPQPVPCDLEGAIQDSDLTDCKQMVCTGGKFVEGPAIPNDGNPCTIDGCNGENPLHDPQNGTPCQLGSSQGTCEKGTCIIACTNDAKCDDENPCTRDTCEQNKCAFTPDDSLMPADANPCTVESCTEGKLSSVPLKDAPCGMAGICNDAGECVGCTADTDCPADDACNDRGCDVAKGQCVAISKGDGPVAAQNPGDCKVIVCAGGQLHTLTDDSDKLVDGNECTQDLCMSGTPLNPSQSAGTACGNNDACDGNGSCVDCANGVGCMGNETCTANHKCETCSDGTQNNGETDIDCGGSKCGNNCTNGNKCLTLLLKICLTRSWMALGSCLASWGKKMLDVLRCRFGGKMGTAAATR